LSLAALPTQLKITQFGTLIIKGESLSSRLESIVASQRFSQLMVATIIGFVLLKRFYRDIGDAFFIITFIGTLLSIFCNFEKIKKDPIYIAFFVSIAIPLLSWINSIIAIPDLAMPKPSPFFFYSFFIFWFIAYWTRGNTNIIAGILIAYCLSALGIFVSNSSDFFGEIYAGISGSRIDFNVVNAQHTSLFSGFGLIASIFLLLARTTTSKHLKLLKSSLAIVFFLFFLLITVITQSRQVWLSLLLCFLAAPLTLKLLPQSRISTKAVVLSYIALFFVLMALSTSQIVSKRINAETDNIKNAATLDIESIPNSGSVGIRINLWIEAWQWFKMRPLLGSGENARELVISESDNFSDTMKSHFSHLHNSHVESLVSFGLVGTVFIYFLIFFPVIRVSKSPRSVTGNTWRIFATTTAIFWMTVNCFESFFFSWNGIYVFSVFYGIIYSFQFKKPALV